MSIKKELMEEIFLTQEYMFEKCGEVEITLSNHKVNIVIKEREQPKHIYTQERIYKRLFGKCFEVEENGGFAEGNPQDVINTLKRKANIYAIKNTVKEWRKQYE